MHSPLIIALDFHHAEDALEMADKLDPRQCRVKVGMELFTATGPAIVDSLQKLGFDVFLDLKFHDIPNTTVQACLSAARLGVWMLNVHASGGPVMLEAVRTNLEKIEHRPLLIGVTVLTSMDNEQLAAIGMQEGPEAQVLRLAMMVQQAGLDGVVASPQELVTLRAEFPKDFLLVTPGVRPTGSALDDQHRVSTPADALKCGANYLVIGRPITRAADPQRALESIIAEIGTI